MINSALDAAASSKKCSQSYAICERISDSYDRWFDRCQKKGSNEKCLATASCVCSGKLNECKEKLNAACFTQFSVEITGLPDPQLNGGCTTLAAPGLPSLTSLALSAFLLLLLLRRQS